MSEREGEQLLQHDHGARPINISNSGDQSSGIRLSATQQLEADAKKKKYIKWGLIGGAITIVVVLAIVLPIVLSNKSSNPEPEPEPVPPGPNPLPYLYNPYNVNHSHSSEDRVVGVIYSPYDYNKTEHEEALKYLTAGLHEDKINTSLFVTQPRGIPVGPNNKFIQNISFEFAVYNPSVALLTLTDADNKRYSIPEEVLEKPKGSVLQKMDMVGFKLFYEPFGFQFEDIRDPTNIFVHTQNSSLVMMDKYIQMDLQLPSQRMYGFGERVREFQLGEGTWTMWATGADSPYDDGIGGKQVYGVHPFILVQGKNKGDFFGMFFRNSNAQSPLIKFNLTTGGSTLSYITTGGQIEIAFFLHGSAKSIIKQYHNMIGNPELPPLWAFGWNQASWAYNTQEDIETMMANYVTADIPLDNVWLDITYLDKYTDFTVDTKAFPDLKGLANKLHDNRQQLVVILDAGISADDKENKYYKMAQDLDILIKSAQFGEDTEYKGALVMKVWPDHTVFIDWLHPDAAQLWQTGLYDLYQQVPYDGLWIDMNEATGFTNGEIKVSEKAQTILNYYKEKSMRFLADADEPRYNNEWYTSFEDQNETSTYYLPFIPGYNYKDRNLDYMSMSLNATHPHSGLTEYDLHNLFGLMMAEHTRAFMTGNKTYPNTDIRPFILTRSTFSSAGKYASHWLGDNWRDWSYMNYSIAGIMNMNMFGVPHVGADVCGFFGEDLDQEMCARWIQLSTFYPFARSHYNRTFNGEPLKKGIEPYNLEGEYLDIGRSSIYDRYQYLRLVYTCVYETMMFGGTCFDPMFFHYPEDDKLYTNIEESFLVAGALKISPILVPGVKDTLPVYFPKGKWVNMADYSEIIEGPITKDITVRKTVLTHLRPGSLIPFQDNSDKKIKKTSQLIEKSISIIANRDEFGKATGTLLLEKGSSRSEINEGHHEYYTISIQANSLQKQLTQGSHASQKAYFESLVLVNAEDLKDVNFACGFSTHFEHIPMSVNYDDAKKTLTIAYQAENPGDHLTFSAFRQINYGVSGKDLNLCEDKQYEYKIKDGYKPDLTKSFETFTLVNQGAYKLPELNVTLQVIDTNIVNVKWKFQNQPEGYRKQFEVPKSIINVKATKTTPHLDIYLDIQTEPNFQIHIQNHGGAYVLSIMDMLLDQNLNIVDVYHNTTKGANFTGIFGLGQKVQKDFFYKDGIYSLWNRDDGTPTENGRPSGNNIYGTHPFYMYQNSKNVWVGVFNNLAAAQDWIVLNNKDLGEVNTTTIAVGGVADMFFIVDTTPDTVLTSYLEIVGKPVLLPQWTLGWHQCRWGYNTTNALYDMAVGYLENKIPLDTVWSDIDYMYNYRDFTVDPQKFSHLPKLIEELHKRNQQYVPIIDAGIAMRQPGNYTSFDLGVEEDVFIKVNGEIFVGQVWPKDAAYPDFFNPKTHDWWKTELQLTHDYIPFDGLWQDMNEASNFCGGNCYPDQAIADPVKFHLPYTPTGRNLERQSIPLDATHSDGTIELDAHSLYGTMQVQTSHEFFREHKNRTFIIGRSSYSGSGKFASLWLGDNESKPSDMGASVLGVMQMSMMGIPMVGADICGFGGTTNGELCARWHYVGAFQPFSRNHNNYEAIGQEPYQFAEDMYEPGISYMDIMTDAILTKYSLVRFYYTHLTKLSLDGGAPFYKPLFFEYPNDMNATLNMTRNVMLGDSLKISHLADSTGQNQTDFYFPDGTWCNILRPAERCFDSNGQVFNMRSKAYDAYAHIRAGRIIPFQDAKSLNYQPGKAPLTVRALQDYPVDLHVNPMTDPFSEALWYAKGIYINDDGYNLTTDGNVNRYQFVASYVEREDAEKIIITVQMEPAWNYLDEKTNCTAINKNDYIHQIYIYDAERLDLSTNQYIAHLHTQEDVDIIITAPVYDAMTDRLVITLDDKAPRCISTIKYIEVQKRV